jgi:hypothetical protein
VSKISAGKLVAGGILAGVVMNICDYVANNFILAADWEHIARIRNVDMADMASTTALVTAIVGDFVLGFLVVWTYAAIRPRLGRGATTALIAGFMVWLSEVLLMVSYAATLFTWDVVFRSGLLLLVTALAGALAGGWVYAEDDDID